MRRLSLLGFLAAAGAAHAAEAPPAPLPEPNIGQDSLQGEPAAVRPLAARTIAVLGDRVRFTDGAEVGRIVDVLVGRDGAPQAAVLDCGGFLGVGNRKVAVGWSTLRFAPTAAADEGITIALTAEDVRAAPEYGEASEAEIVTTAPPAPVHAARPPEPAGPPGPPLPSAPAKPSAPAARRRG